MGDPRQPASERPSARPLRGPRPGRTRRYLATVVAAIGVVILAYLAQPYVKLLGPPERCWEIQEVDGRLYKVNPCTGQFRLLGDAPKSDGGR